MKRYCLVCLERCHADLCDEHTALLRHGRAAYEAMVERRHRLRELGADIAGDRKKRVAA